MRTFDLDAFLRCGLFDRRVSPKLGFFDGVSGGVLQGKAEVYLFGDVIIVEVLSAVAKRAQLGMENTYNPR